MLDWTLFVGFSGMSLILLAFILNVFTKLQSSNTNFLLLNLCGSICMIVYALLIGSIPTLILNVVWAISAGWGIIHHKRRAMKFNMYNG